MLPCPSPSPKVCSHSCPLRWRCYPTIPSSVTPFSCPQPFPVSGSFLLSQLFASGGQSIGASASASVLPMNIQGWFPLGLTDLTIIIVIILQGIGNEKWKKVKVAQSCPTLRTQGLRRTRLTCLSLSPGVCSNSCPLSQWCYLTILSSATILFHWARSSHLVAKVLELQL